MRLLTKQEFKKEAEPMLKRVFEHDNDTAIASILSKMAGFIPHKPKFKCKNCGRQLRENSTNRNI